MIDRLIERNKIGDTIKADSLKHFLNQRVEIFLQNNLKYTGYIKEIKDDTILFLDKYNNEIIINIYAIYVIQPAREEEKI